MGQSVDQFLVAIEVIDRLVRRVDVRREEGEERLVEDRDRGIAGGVQFFEQPRLEAVLREDRIGPGDPFGMVPDALEEFGDEPVVVQLRLLAGVPGSGPGRVGQVVLLGDHPVEAVHVLVPLGDVPGERVVAGAQRRQGVLVHRPHRQVHPPQAFLWAELRGVGQVLDHDRIPGFLDDLGTDYHAAEVPRHAADERAGLRLEADLDVSEAGDVRPDELAEEMVASLRPFLFEDPTSRQRLLHRSGPDLHRAVDLRLEEHGVPGLEPGVRDPTFRQGDHVRRTAGQLKLTAFHFPHSTSD